MKTTTFDEKREIKRERDLKEKTLNEILKIVLKEKFYRKITRKTRETFKNIKKYTKNI